MEDSVLLQTMGRVDTAETYGRLLVVSAEVAKVRGTHLRLNVHTTHLQEMQTPVAVVVRASHVILRATAALVLKGLVRRGTTPADSMAQASERWVETVVAAFFTSRLAPHRRFLLNRRVVQSSMVRHVLSP